MKHHVAILSPGWIPLILTGEKTIESRFTKTRCAPFNQVRKDDVLYLKESGGNILGQATVHKVETFENLVYRTIQKIYYDYYTEIFGEFGYSSIPSKWISARYATLLHLKNPVTFEKPIPFVKRDPRAWVVLSQGLDIGDNTNEAAAT